MELLYQQVAPNFDPIKSEHYSLSVLLKNDGFVMLITDCERDKSLAIAEYKMNGLNNIFYLDSTPHPALESYFKALAGHQWARLIFKNKKICIASPRIMVLPETFAVSGTGIYSFSQHMSDSDQLMREAVYEKGPEVQLAVPKPLMEKIANIFPGIAISPQSVVFIRALMRRHSQIIARQIFVNVFSDFIEIAVIQGLRLLFLNTFRYQAPSDVLYYVIFVLEQIGLEPSAEEITLSGEVEEDGEIYNQLALYCGKLTFSAEDASGSWLIPPEKSHRYFTLLNLAACE